MPKIKLTIIEIILLLFLVVYFSSPLWAVDGKGTTRLLKEQGYSKIEILGSGWLSCSKGAVFSTKFTAINPNKKQVTGTVCRGLFKNSTIRWE